ncbi:MAG TPA: ABC transporter substrate-binding protein [Vicinamibacterales bacterium]|nr:ABC transporter substrate-binding protein [Vicinamibacterales bacterium]
MLVITAPSAATQPHPRRIVSLIPAVTEMLFALGAGDRVVGVSSFDRFPPDVAGVQKVGALLDPNLEKILSLKPDLVAVYHSQEDFRRQLDRAGVPTYIYTHAGLADVTATIRSVGQRIGSSERGHALAKRIETQLDAIRKSVAGKRRPRTLIVFGRENYSLRGIYASGGKGFIHDMVTLAGGDNVFADVKREAVQATTELILSRRPEVIVELRADPLTREEERKELAVWGQLTSVPAVRNGRVHLIVDARTVIPGPRVAEGVDVIRRTLH